MVVMSQLEGAWQLEVMGAPSRNAWEMPVKFVSMHDTHQR